MTFGHDADDDQLVADYPRATCVVLPSVDTLPDGRTTRVPELLVQTLLEGMACGCFPVAGDLESIREWITPNENGLLFDPTNPQSIAESILAAIENKNLRRAAAGLNREIISARAEYGRNMQRAEDFYARLVK